MTATCLLTWHLVLAGFLVADLISLSWVGMWQGLIRRKPNRAALFSLARILALPPLLFLLGDWFCAIIREPFSGAHDTAWQFFAWVFAWPGGEPLFWVGSQTQIIPAIPGRRVRRRAAKRAAKPAPRPARELAEAP